MPGWEGALENSQVFQAVLHLFKRRKEVSQNVENCHKGVAEIGCIYHPKPAE